MILPTGPATGNRTCILEKKRQQGFSGETTLVVPRCLLNRVAATAAAFPLFTEKSAVESSRGKKAFDERIAARLENIEQQLRSLKQITIEEIESKIAIHRLTGYKRDFGVSRRWKIGVIRRIFPDPLVQGWRRRIMHVEWRTHARCLRGQLFPVMVKEVTIVLVTVVIGIRNVTRFNIDNRGYEKLHSPEGRWAAKEDRSTLVWNNIKIYTKIIKFKKWKPAIHLDNRYRLMRQEPMLDADGNVTNELGEDCED
ncbi:hypothetical protein G5I_12777 [Acromyrmex echinatior]|uniref:Uncharacterized protein n=1 Tax=Acromyrmex echinatior TaxID=103372 RepID=F4X385_ACREC|nr:hypothetical protein G5I_12777 [Acromyrmex echinatior]